MWGKESCYANSDGSVTNYPLTLGLTLSPDRIIVQNTLSVPVNLFVTKSDNRHLHHLHLNYREPFKEFQRVGTPMTFNFECHQSDFY